MTFKVGDKVRCIKTNIWHYTEGKVYCVVDVEELGTYICIIDDKNRKRWSTSSKFELVQDDKLPQSQTKKLSKPIRSCEHNGSIYKEDTIDGVSIEDMKQTRDNINSKLQIHRNLFFNPKKK